MLAPEERNCTELLSISQHVARRSLTLALGNDPVLHANRLAAVRIRPSRNIAGRENSSGIGLQVRIDEDTMVEREAGLFRQFHPRPHTHANDHQVGLQRSTAA